MTERSRMPFERRSITHKVTLEDQDLYITVGLYDSGNPGEVFVRISKQGSTIAGLVDAAAMLLSLLLQHGVPIQEIAGLLRWTNYPPHGFTSNPEIPKATSVWDYIIHYIEHKFGGVDVSPTVGSLLPISGGSNGCVLSGNSCPECGLQTIYQEGCEICMGCGWSKC